MICRTSQSILYSGNFRVTFFKINDLGSSCHFFFLILRVNRVLKRLTLFDAQMSQGAEINPPPIVAIEPFEFDDTGSVFKSYPGHTSFAKKCKTIA